MILFIYLWFAKILLFAYTKSYYVCNLATEDTTRLSSCRLPIFLFIIVLRLQQKVPLRSEVTRVIPLKMNVFNENDLPNARNTYLATRAPLQFSALPRSDRIRGEGKNWLEINQRNVADEAKRRGPIGAVFPTFTVPLYLCV